jgi:hypothetical protein
LVIFDVMKNTLLTTLLSLGLAGITFAMPQKGQIDLSEIPVPRWHYQPEYTFDTPSDPVSWTKQKAGLHAAFGSTDKLYLRCEVPEIDKDSVIWKQTGWRGERMNAQVLIWSPDSLEQIRVRLNDLMKSGGKVISTENFKISFIRYVVSNFPYGATGFGCDVPLDSAWLMPDRFEPFERFELPGKTVRPVWITIDIPEAAEPGNYVGAMEIVSTESKVYLKVDITVQQQLLPKPHDWKFRLDLWQNPWVIASYFDVEPWSAEHKMLLKEHLKLYAGAGGKFITTYAVHSPWSDNSYRIEGTMIDWIRTAGNSWKFNYSIFDQYVELAMETGIDEAITIYTPVPWGHRFRYFDEQSGNYKYEEWSPASPEYRTFWNIFLSDLKTHLTQKGWFGKTYLGINENPLEYTLAAIKVIKEHARDWKITYAGDWHPELSPLLDDYSPVISSEPGLQEIKERSSGGLTTTYYVCCNPPRPNNFVFSPPVEGRFISWYAAASGYNGFLRWAYDAWPADPVRDARHTLWPAGDCFFVYPGGNSSIRFEKLREGITDFEKIRILRELVAKSGNEHVKELMNDLEALLATFVAERDYSKRKYDAAGLTEAIHKGTQLIRDISEEFK